jgi:Bacterial TniB protein
MGMTAEFDHLAPECREDAALPAPERIHRIQAERWISYPRAQTVLDRFEELLHYPQRDRMPCVLLHAATGMGKTKILRKFRRDHPATFDPGAGVQRMRVVAMQMPPEPDEKSFYAQLLSSVEAPVRASMNVHQMRYIVRDLLGYIGARLLIIDEVHTLLASTYRQQRILLNTLRYLANELRIPMVCAGTAEAKTALITDQQLADRFEELRRSSDLTSPACRRLLLDRTDGVTVRIVRLLETLAIDAVRSGKEKIDRDSLETLRVPPPLLSMGHAVEKALS